MTLPVGLMLSPSPSHDPLRILAIAEYAERLGYRSVWFAESDQADAVGLLHAAAVRTSSLRLGTAVVPIQTRTPALLAMGFSVLSYLAPNRTVLGVGHSSPNVAGKWHGRPYDPREPIAQVKEFVEAFRSCFSGEKTSFTGRWFSSHGLRLRLPPNPTARRVPVFVGALGNASIRRAREFADGVVVSYILPQRAAELSGSVGGERSERPRLDADESVHPGPGSARAGSSEQNGNLKERPSGAATTTSSGSSYEGERSSSGFEFVVTLNVGAAEKDDPLESAATDFRRQIVNYGIVDAYANAFRLAGFEEVVKEVRDRWGRGDRKGALEAVPLDMCRTLACFGRPGEVASRIVRYINAGVSEVVLSVIERPGLLSVEDLMSELSKALAGQVAPG